MKRYEGSQRTVSFDPARCLHAGECVRGLPEVFDAKKRPWIQPDGAAGELIDDVVARCPSGALQVEGIDEAPRLPHPPELHADEGGPLWIRGEVQLTAADGSERTETRMAACTCGASENKPYCDGSGSCKS